MTKTGHSSDAVRNYKRVSDDKLCGLTEVIATKAMKSDVNTVGNVQTASTASTSTSSASVSSTRRC